MWKWIKSRSPYVLVIGVLLFIILLQNECRGRLKCPDCKADTIVKTVIRTDTTLIRVTEYIPRRKERIITQNIYIPTIVDTAAILADYFAKYYYVDTLLNDTSAWIVVYDTISRNKIQSRQVEFRNRRPVQINTYTTEIIQKKWNIGVGVFVGGLIQADSGRFDAGFGAILSTKGKSTYGVEFNPFDRSFRVCYYWNLRK